MVPGEHIMILNLTVFIAYFLQQKQFISYPSGYMENWSPMEKRKPLQWKVMNVISEVCSGFEAPCLR